jgi:hypothetical protein
MGLKTSDELKIASYFSRRMNDQVLAEVNQILKIGERFKQMSNEPAFGSEAHSLLSELNSSSQRLANRIRRSASPGRSLHPVEQFVCLVVYEHHLLHKVFFLTISMTNATQKPTPVYIQDFCDDLQQLGQFARLMQNLPQDPPRLREVVYSLQTSQVA